MLEFIFITIGVSCFLLGKSYGIYVYRKQHRIAARMEASARELEQICQRVVNVLETAMEEDRLDLLARLTTVLPDDRVH